MAKILASNNMECFNYIHRIQVENGFNRFTSDACGNLNVCAYKKLNFDNENYVKTDRGFITCVGTLLYKGKIGKTALVDLFNDFIHSGTDIRKDCRGFFCVCISIGNETRFFTDKNGEYSLYYFYKDGTLIISSQYYYILKATGCNVHHHAIQERCIHYCNIDKETPFSDVYRLRGSEELIYTSGSELKIITTDTSIKTFSDQNISYHSVAELLKENAKQISSCFSDFALFSTGGFDSRLALAVMLAVGIKPKLLSWEGDLFSANADPNDRIVSNQLAEKYHLPIEHIRFSSDYMKKNNGELQCLVRQYGELSKVYSSNTAYFDELSKLGDTYVTSGYFGEIYRSNDRLDKVFYEPFNVNDFVRLFYLDRGFEKAFSDEKQIREYLITNVTNLALSLGLDISSLSKEDCMKLHFYYRTHADTVTCQLINMFTYSTNILSPVEAVDETLRMPYHEKGNSKMQMMCTKDLLSDIYDVSLYSHQAFYRIDTNLFIAKRIEPQSTVIKNKIRKILGDELYASIKKAMGKSRMTDNSLTVNELLYYEKCIEEFEKDVGFKLDYDKSKLFTAGRFELAVNYYYLLAYMAY